MPKPSEFYVGVIDLFAIILPGAIATALLEPKLSDMLFGAVLSEAAGDAAKWAVFLAISYFVGHLIFLLGSLLDPGYNWLRQQFNPYGEESAYQCARRIRDLVIDSSEQQALNPFQWSRSVLLAKTPACASDVHRLEADSKFFRSLVVVGAIALVTFFVEGKAGEGLLAIVVMAACYVRYYERRLKSTTQAYIHLITLYRLGGLADRPLKPPSTGPDASIASAVPTPRHESLPVS